MPGRRLQSRSSVVATEKLVRRATRLPHFMSDDRSDLCEVQVVDEAKVSLARAAVPEPAVLSAFAARLRALGDPTRLQLVCALAADGVAELCVCDLATLTGVSDSAVSHSLRTLRHLGLVRYRKVGRIAYYMLRDARFAALVGDVMRPSRSSDVPRSTRIRQSRGKLNRSLTPIKPSRAGASS